MKEYYKHLCACGCEGRIEIRKTHKYDGIPKYLPGHHMKNMKLSEEWKSNISKGMKGKKKAPFSIKHRKNISKSKKGKKQSKETIRKRTEKMMGEKNPSWRGGISCEPYCEQWMDQEYKQSIRDRDGNKCLNPYCNNNYNKNRLLDIHHINYNKKDCKPTNLITVCKSCNTRANKDRDWHQSWYEAIIYRRYLNEY